MEIPLYSVYNKYNKASQDRSAAAPSSRKETAMELNQLEYFRALAGIRHFTRAAEEIAISQSALSRSVRRLEEELGTPLFTRGTKEIELTEAGRHFLTHVERALSELARGRQEIESERAPDRGVINLSFMHSLGSHILPELLSEFKRDYPHIQFNLDQNNSALLAKSLVSGTADLSLCSTMGNMEQLAWLYLYTEELFAVFPEDHPLASRASIQLREIENEPLITLKPNYSLRILTDQFCAIAGIRPAILFEGDDIVTTASLVAAHLGVSLLPRTPAMDTSGLVFLPISFPICKREIGIAWNAARPLSPAAYRFQQFIIDRFAKTTKQN